MNTMNLHGIAVIQLSKGTHNGTEWIDIAMSDEYGNTVFSIAVHGTPDIKLETQNDE